MNKIFERYAEHAFDENTKENSILWKRKWYDANFKKFFPPEFTAKLLDIGPGLGELLITEREWGYQNCYAIDISPSVIRYCRQKGLNCEKVNNTVMWLCEHEESFDVITVLDVFEHIPLEQSLDFLLACKKALDENGILILQVPNIQSAEGYLHRYNDITHVFGYSQHTLEQLITTVGFETVKFYPFEEYPGNDADTKLIRRLRSIYWKYIQTNRMITHNLNASILTPELFAVMTKKKCKLPGHMIEDEFSDGKILMEDICNYIDRIGIEIEIFEKIGQIDKLEKRMLDQQKNYYKEWEKLNAKLELLSVRLEKQHCSLLQSVGKQNEQIQNRLDYLEMKTGKMDKLLMNMRHPLSTFINKIRKNNYE